METAALRVVEVLEERFNPLKGKRISIACGKGNNGGDGLSIARQLCARTGAIVTVWLAGEASSFRGDAATNYKMLQSFGVTIGPAIIEARDKFMQTDPATGVIYDAVGSEMVEEALNVYQAKLTTTLRREGKILAQPRYSPGYGDCAIHAQDVFFKHLPMTELGVTLTPAYIMRPEKSITAFAGINY